MKTYKAIVTDKETKRTVIVESEAYTKAEFIHDLRRNGYAVNPYKVKEKEVFTYIMEFTNCYPWDWEHINKVPDGVELS